MIEHEEIERLSTPYSKMFMILFSIVSFLVLAFFFTGYDGMLGIVFAYILPLTFLFAIVLVVLLYLQGRSTLPKIPLMAGLLFSIGGVMLDAVATVINTPNLEEEANVIARMLLESGHSVGFVYVYGAVSQTLYLILVCGLWVTFLRHRDTLITSAMSTLPKTRLEFVKAATGGAHLSWRQYFLPLKVSELPRSYHLMLFLAVTLTGCMLFNWYLGLSWFDVLPTSHTIAIIICIIFSVMIYTAWLWFQYSPETTD